MGQLQVGGDQALDRVADQFGVGIAEHFLQPPVGEHERAVTVGQRDPVVEGVDHFPQQALGHGSRALAAPRAASPAG